MKTGIETYDRLAVEAREELKAFLGAVKGNGWIVKATDKLPAYTIAQYFPRKRRFYYAPKRMTFLDMLHEQHHLHLFQQRGNWKTNGGQVWRDEISAYMFEYELGKREGFASRYMEFLALQIEYFQSRLSEAKA